MDRRTVRLTEAMRAEDDHRVRNRMAAVRHVLMGYTTKAAADFIDVDVQTVQLWLKRFDAGGIDCLRDSTGRARPGDPVQ